MQARIGLWVVACLAMALMLFSGCSREETAPDTGSGMPMEDTAMPMAHPEGMPHAMTTMHDMQKDMLGQEVAASKDMASGQAMAEGGQAMGDMMVAQTDNGAALFKQHCSVCHPGGKNIINPEKTLEHQTLAKNGITRPEDIMKLVRNPGPGMTPFTPDALSDADARQVAEYILSTF